jgi:hypothetical protein
MSSNKPDSDLPIFYSINQNIEANAIKAIISHEESRGAKCSKVKKGSGYDLISIKGTEERHIEVKSSNKPKIRWRWLEPTEYALLLNDPLFYIYLVTNCASKPKIIKLNQKQVRELNPKPIKKYEIKFHSLYKTP